MSGQKWLTLTICVALGAGRADAQETDLRAFIKKAINAHGGAESLNKYHASAAKFKGTVELMGQMREFNGEMSYQSPDKFNIASSLVIANQTFQLVHVSNGKKFWISELGKTKEITDEKALKQTRYTLGLDQPAHLVSLLDKACELTTVGDFKVKDRDVLGIRASRTGEPDITLFFDKNSHLLAKTEMRVLDAMTEQEFTQEKFFLDYKNVSGVKTAGRLVIHKDGKDFIDLEFSETRHFEKLDDSHFAMP
jgi:outer membrane lipoprotein-sorting protein